MEKDLTEDLLSHFEVAVMRGGMDFLSKLSDVDGVPRFCRIELTNGSRKEYVLGITNDISFDLGRSIELIVDSLRQDLSEANLSSMIRLEIGDLIRRPKKRCFLGLLKGSFNYKKYGNKELEKWLIWNNLSQKNKNTKVETYFAQLNLLNGAEKS